MQESDYHTNDGNSQIILNLEELGFAFITDIDPKISEVAYREAKSFLVQI